MIPKTYKINNGCWNCKKVFIYTNYEEDIIYYCTFDGKKRPLSDSFTLNESISNYLKKQKIYINTETYYNKFHKLIQKWYKWADSHKVESYGICNNHKI